MKPAPLSWIIKILKITGIAAAVILLLMFLTPYLFPSLVTEQTKKWANNHLEGELNFSGARLSFFHHFPSLTLTLYHFSLKGSRPYAGDTLLSSEEIALGINLGTLFFKKKVNINKVFLTKAFMNVQVNEKGEANYNVYESTTGKKKTAGADTSEGSLQIERIEINDSRLVYNDRSLPLLINAHGFNYSGKGDLSKEIFDLYTKATIDSMDLYFDNAPYVINKKINAELVTKINTSSLAFIFEKNELKINQLPIEFTGRFDFLENGYDMDFDITSNNSKLYNVFTALPPAYNTWLQKADVKGTADIKTTLKGKYIVSENKMPDFTFGMKLRDGYISYDKAPMAASDILLNLDVKMPALNTDSLSLNIDTVSLAIGKEYLNARLYTKGIAEPAIYLKGRINADIDLARLDQALGFTGFDVKGKCRINGVVNGTYERGNGINGLSPKKFPVANLDINLTNGSIQTSYYPHPIQNIQLAGKITDATGTLKDLEVVIKPASFVFEGKPFDFKASMKNFEDVAYDISAKGDLDLKKIYKVFAQEGLGLQGFARADVHFQGKQSDAVNGRYEQLNNEGSLDLKDIYISSEYLPKPFIIQNGLFLFKQDKMNFNKFTASYGASDFTMDGYLQNVINYVLSEDGKLKGSFSLSSGLTNVDEFVAFAGTSDSAAASSKASVTDTVRAGSGVVVIPSQLDLSVRAKAGNVLYNALMLQNFTGDLTLSNSQAILKQTVFNLIGCKVSMDATYGSISAKRAVFEYKILAEDFDVQRAYKEIALFREMAPSAATAQGIISLDYNLKGKLNGDMFPVFPSLSGGGVLSVKEVKVKGFKLFNAVSSKTGKNDIRDPSFKKVDLKTTIKNNIITLERVKMKVAGFRPRIEGQTSFDGRVNFKMRLGLPPLGIIGIPIKVTGTQDKPIIKLGRKTEDLTETEDTGE